MYYDGVSSLTHTHQAHFRNGLKMSVLDQDLSLAQLAQLEDFLEFDVEENLIQTVPHQ